MMRVFSNWMTRMHVPPEPFLSEQQERQRNERVGKSFWSPNGTQDEEDTSRGKREERNDTNCISQSKYPFPHRQYHGHGVPYVCTKGVMGGHVCLRRDCRRTVTPQRLSEKVTRLPQPDVIHDA